jgi:hypothetical protein
VEATPGSHGPDITPKFAEGLMPRRRIDRKAPDTFRSRTSSTIDVGVAKGFLADSNSTVDYSMTGSNLSRPAASGVYSDSILGRLAALGRSG